MARMRLRWLRVALVFLAISITTAARGDPEATDAAAADPAPGADAVGADLAGDDALAPEHAPRERAPRETGTRERARSWVTLTGFASALPAGKEDLGAMLVVGLALDRLGGGARSIADPAAPSPSLPAPPARASPASPLASPSEGTPGAVAPSLARRCVQAAWRASGLGPDDSRLDDLASRARTSAWLPDLRVRGMRLLTDAAHATTLASTDGTTYYAAAGANLVLELRLTWRLDRLVYSGDEPGIERLRLERQAARARLATRTLEVLVAWWRARADVAASLSGSREETEGRLRIAETQATLDVLTDGWFSLRSSEPAVE